jgi:hypothetical protein
MRSALLLSAIAAFACAERVQVIDPPWPSDRTVVVVELGPAPKATAYAPGAKIELPVTNSVDTRVLIYTYPGTLPAKRDPVRCGVLLDGAHPITAPLLGLWSSDPVDLGEGRLTFEEVPLDAFPEVRPSYRDCLSDDFECAALTPEVIATPLLDANVSRIALVEDELLFYALEPTELEPPKFRLFRHEVGGREHQPIDPPPGADELIEALAYWQGELVVTVDRGRSFYYSREGRFLRQGPSQINFRSLATGSDLLVHYGELGVRTEPPGMLGALHENVHDLAVLSSSRAVAVTDTGLRIWEDAEWKDYGREGTIGAGNNWHVGLDETVIVAVSESGDIVTRTEPDEMLANLGRPFGDGSNLRGAVGLGEGRWLVTGENGQVQVQHSVGQCALGFAGINNLRRAYRLPGGRTVWIGANDVESAARDPALLLRLPLPLP